jgi:hypothetical protein
MFPLQVYFSLNCGDSMVHLPDRSIGGFVRLVLTASIQAVQISEPSGTAHGIAA